MGDDVKIKIAVPWPYNPPSQPRIKEALSLWENKEDLLLCLVEPSKDEFLREYDTTVLSRNSRDIGTSVPKCYIYDMVKSVRDMYPECQWVGFGNSDCVPVGDMLSNNEDKKVLIYHRTEIPAWENRLRIFSEASIDATLNKDIWEWRKNGDSDKKICRRLNRIGVKPLEGSEWTYPVLKRLFMDQGFVFFWGQDMYLFRADVVDKVLNDYLKPMDYILGTGGFDPRLSKWLVENFNATRVIHKIFHKMHNSEWNINEVEYLHNGGDIDAEKRAEYFEDTFLLHLCDQGQKGSIPKYIKYLVGKNNPELYDSIVLE